MVQWIEHQPAKQRVAGAISRQGTGSPVGGAWEATTHWCFSPSFSPSLQLSLNINKYFFHKTDCLKGRDDVFYPQDLVQSLAHHNCSVNIILMDSWVTQFTGLGFSGPSPGFKDSGISPHSPTPTLSHHVITPWWHEPGTMLIVEASIITFDSHNIFKGWILILSSFYI